MKNTLRVCLALLVATLALSVGVVEAQTCPPPPFLTPEPIGPSGDILGTRPTFSWNAVPGYFNYVFKLLYADPNGNFVNPPGGLVPVFGTSWTPPFDLPIEQQMRWQVKIACTNSSGGQGFGLYGPELFFKIVDPVEEDPACGQCFGGLNSCLAACPGVCERKVTCGTSGYKCFC